MLLAMGYEPTTETAVLGACLSNPPEPRAGICGLWQGVACEVDAVLSSSRSNVARGREPLRPKGFGGVGASAVLRTLDDGHRIAFAHDALQLDPRRRERGPREKDTSLLEP